MGRFAIALPKKVKNDLFLTSFGLAIVFFCSGCMKETAAVKDAGLNGCISATALNPTTIEVLFEYPEDATKVTVLRNSAPVGVFLNASVTTFTDSGLAEGTTYYYECIITQDNKDHLGNNKITATTTAVNPPTFSGITSATLVGGNVVLSWNIPTGVPTKAFRVYANPGSASGDINFSLSPFSTITNPSSTSISIPVASIGDEMPYQFAVRACNISDICDSNTATRSLTLVDRGAPTTMGATAVTIVNGKAQITAPWTFSNGSIKFRHVYRKIASGSFTLIQTFNVPSPYIAPPTGLTLNEVLLENEAYSYYVIDEDPTGNLTNTASAIVSINSGDINAPVFTGIETLVSGSPADTVATLGWTAIASQPGSSSGASHYLIYRQTLGLADPITVCTNGTLVAQVDATLHTAGNPVSYSMTGLTERTRYAFCVKARDLAGNISTTTANLDIITKDITAPSYNGVTGISYNNEHNRVELVWTPSSSSDVKEYKIKVWKGSQTVPVDLATLPAKSHASYSTGATFKQTDYAYVDNETIYVQVNACDDAFPTYGTQNCTNISNTQALSLVIPDITPPAGFAGITAATADPTEEGKITVNWAAPTPSWAEYRGFKVYALQNDSEIPAVALKDCPCSGNHCPNTITSCVIQGLPAFKTYNLYVAGYDITGNITSYLNPPGSYKRTVRTTDLTVPIFSSNFDVGAGANPTLTWNAATDNQQDSSLIRYSVYRKRVSNFVDPKSRPDLDPSPNIIMVANKIVATSIVDSTTLVEGNVYYYIVCAFDQSNNMSCDDNNIKQVVIDDLTPPAINTLAVKTVAGIARTVKDKLWKLDWVLLDAGTDNSQIYVDIYKKIGADEDDIDVVATTSDTLVTSGYGITSVTNQSGPYNQNRYINYLIKARDLAGNTGEASITVKSANKVSVSYLSRNEGHRSGGKMLLVKGSGFGNGARIKIGPNYCDTGLTRNEFDVMTCLTPAYATETSLVVQVENEDGQTVTAGTYTYTDSYICDQAQPPSGMAAGAGSQIDPYLICNGTQLNRLREVAPINYFQGKFYFKLMDHIDLSSWTSNSFAPIGDGGGVNRSLVKFDGNNMMISNYTYNDNTKSLVGLFALLGNSVTGETYMKNLFLNNFSITGNSIVGILAGYMDMRTGDSIENIHILKSRLNGNSNLGGIVGRIQCTLCNTATKNIYVELDVPSGSGIGGFLAYSHGSMWIDQSSFKVTTSNAGASSVGSVFGQLNGSGTYQITNTSIKSSLVGINTIGGAIGNGGSGNTVSLQNVFADVSITGGATGRLGGLVGDTSSHITLSKVAAKGSISGGTNYVGGIVGRYNVNGAPGLTISDAYSAVNINCTGASCGAGVVGGYDGTVLNLSRIYSSAVLTDSALNSIQGPIVSTPTITSSNNFYCSEFTGNASSGLSSGATDLSIANMRTPANFTSEGWNFSTVWKMPTSNTINNGFPILRGVTPEWE